MEHPRRLVEQPKRILIVGSPGSGSAEVAASVGERLALPVISLNRERAAVKTPEWGARAAVLAANEVWVMEGADATTFNVCTQRTDWIVWFDIPMPVCLFRALGQIARRSRGGAVERKGERLDWRSVGQIWRFPNQTRPRIVELVNRQRRAKTIFILHSQAEIDDFLGKLPSVSGLGEGFALRGDPRP